MKTLIIPILCLWTSFLFAADEVGNVLQVLGGKEAYVQRGGTRDTLTPNLVLLKGDEIHTENSIVVIHVFPSTQVSLSQKTIIRLSESYIEEVSEGLQKSFSLIDFVKGLVRIQVTREADQQVEQKVKTALVTMGVRGTEFEISEEEDDIDLDVIEGEVSVTTNDASAQAEVVKQNEGIKFSRKEKRFKRRALREKFKHHPGFMKREALRQKWKEKREQRRLRKRQTSEHRERKAERKSDRRRRDR